jgi:hypothetical protein
MNVFVSWNGSESRFLDAAEALLSDSLRVHVEKKCQGTIVVSVILLYY